MTRTDWTFAQYIEEIVMISEIIEIPGMKQKRDDLIKEVWERYPVQCEELGLRDGVK
jgi:hypothetical protein